MLLTRLVTWRKPESSLNAVLDVKGAFSKQMHAGQDEDSAHFEN